MAKYENDEELKQFVQAIVEKVTLYPCVRIRKFQNVFNITLLSLETRKLKKIHSQMESSARFRKQQIKTQMKSKKKFEPKKYKTFMQYDKEIQELKKNIQELRDKIVQQHQQSPMKRHSAFVSISQDGISNSERKVKDLEDNVKIKYLKIENIINMLMENQLLMKNQIAEISKRNDENNNTSISSHGSGEKEETVIPQLEQKIDIKCVEFKSQLEDIYSDLKQTMQGKLLFYWKVLDDQIQQIESLRSDVELIYSDPKNYYKRRVNQQYLTTQ